MACVLFVCLHNAGRSQMSQALFERAAAGSGHEAASAREAGRISRRRAVRGHGSPSARVRGERRPSGVRYSPTRSGPQAQALLP
jgi:hypothetical protein